MPNWGNAVEKEATVASTSPNKYPPIKAGLHRAIDKLALDDLIKSIPDAQLRGAIAREVAKLKANKKFGLVFEEHAPEKVQLPNFPVQVGATVVKRGDSNNEVFKVGASVGVSKVRITREAGEGEETVSAKELVVIKKFGEPIYPTLTPIGRVPRGQDKPYHTIINADNFHALQLLLYCYEGQVDVIYIDPPYNTGARDWKYNNDYVDKNDQYRHSKWLSMMKKRLLLAKRLLKSDGLMICTIDENEHPTLILQLKEIFSAYEITSIAIVHNPRGVQGDNFSYTNEFAVYAIPRGIVAVSDRKLNEDEQEASNLRNWGSESLREDAKNCFYPIIVRDGSIIGFGDVPDNNFHPKAANSKRHDGTVEVWPIDKSGVERKWRYARQSVEAIKDLLEVSDDDDQIQVLIRKTHGKYKTVWKSKEYDAGTHGSRLVMKVLGKKFPFPKSLYAVKECLRAVVKHKPKALILDFFAGSGTTLHATCLLNQEDSGSRRCILVTNNEVGEKLADRLNKKGYFPGDAEFEREGICESVTWPRCKYAVNGKRDDGTDLPGTYLNGRAMKDGFAENVEYFKLDFLDPHEVAYGEKFEAILPILWLMAGAEGERDKPARGYGKWFVPESSPYAVLIKEDHFAEFKRKIKLRSDITHVFLVTDSEEAFREMTAELPSSLRTKMLYKSYLDNFRINTEKNL